MTLLRTRRRALVTLAVLVAAPSAPGVAASGPTEALPCVQVPWHNDRCPEWTSVYDNPTGGSGVVGEDGAVASTLGPDGSRLFVTGTSRDNDTGRDIVTVAFDTADGALAWVARHDSPAEGAEVPSDIAVSPDGSRVFVTGVEDDGLENVGTPSEDGRAVTLAYDAGTGELLWRATYDGPGGKTDMGHSVAVAPDGAEVYVSVSSVGSDDVPERVTLAYWAGSGEVSWRAIRSSPPGGWGDPRSRLVVSPDGSRVYVASLEFPAQGAQTRDFVVAAYGTGRDDDEPAGAELWAARHAADGTGEVRAMGIAPGGESVFVAGRDRLSWTVLAFSSSGGLRWTSILPDAFDAWPNDLAVGPGGDRVYVTGTRLRSFDLRDSLAAVTVAYDAVTGQEAWTAEYDPPGGFREEGTALGVGADGTSIFVGGLASPTGNSSDPREMLTLAYDAEGTQLWVARLHDPPVSKVAAGRTLAVGRDRVYVAGSIGRVAALSPTEETANRSDLLVAAYASEVGEPHNVTCAVEPRDPEDGSPLGGFGTPQVRADTIFLRASDRGSFEVDCTSSTGEPFGVTVRYHFEVSPEPGVWETLAPTFACAASSVPVGGGGTHTAVIVVPGTPSCDNAELIFPENHHSLGLPHRLCVAVLKVSGCSPPWVHQKIG